MVNQGQRTEEILRRRLRNFARLSQEQKDDLQLAAQHREEGGASVARRSVLTAMGLDLVYPSTGKLRADIYRFLRGER